MRVHGVIWAGTRTAAFDETVAFFRDLLGVPLERVNDDFAWARMPDTSQFEVFGGGDRHHLEFTTGPVPEFLVDDLADAIQELRAAGVPIVGRPVADDGTGNGWCHFVAPDGNVYGLTNGPQYARPRGGDPAPAPLPREIGSPATNALRQAGVKTLDALVDWSERDLLALHGVGPKAVRILRETLAATGRAFRS